MLPEYDSFRRSCVVKFLQAANFSLKLSNTAS